ncbi:hypothetical protein E2C01_026889 [Portunus trituberculatus]|uniref:Uncharacterized protein n=1 Tax=Portunus trituberculatus TaxID=210409 RepID=A0A5B7EK13_PORTR|nr:hypothetical protein [Portunus trituberculatus]
METEKDDCEVVVMDGWWWCWWPMAYLPEQHPHHAVRCLSVISDGKNQEATSSGAACHQQFAQKDE